MSTRSFVTASFWGAYIKSRISDEDMWYVFLDEVQLCRNFETILNGLNRRENVDLYVTGSNSKFLSSDVLTEFRGRGDEVRVYPLSLPSIMGSVKNRSMHSLSVCATA